MRKNREKESRRESRSKEQAETFHNAIILSSNGVFVLAIYFFNGKAHFLSTGKGKTGLCEIFVEYDRCKSQISRKKVQL